MNLKNCCRWAVPSVLLAISGGVIAATPTVDGTRDASAYGTTPLVVQKASVISILSDPFSLELNVDNSNIGGVGLLAAGDFVSPGDSVFTGFELSVSLAELGWNGTQPIRFAAFVNGSNSDFLANQVAGGLPAGEPNLGGTPFDFDAIPGDQFVTVATVRSNEAVNVNGTLAENYGPALWVNTQNPTGFGDNNNDGPIVATGSEINAVYAFRDDKGTPSTADDTLHIFVAGNLETNYNKLEFFFDVAPGGQNPLASPPNPNFGGLTQMQNSVFDAGFTPNYYIRYTTGGGGMDPTGFQHFIDMVPLGGTGDFLGGGRANSLAGTGPNGGAFEANLDNSNIAGVSSPGGGVGPDTPFVTDPATVTTGLEFKIDLDAIGFDGTGFDGAGNIAIGGFIRTGNLIFNQVIGGLPNDTNNIGRADGVDFNDFAGNQYAVVSSTPVAGAITINGVLDGAYGSPIYVNNAGGTGNSVSPQLNADNTTNVGPDGNPDGSEINAVYAAVRNESGTNFLYVFVAGNFGQYHRTSIFIDAIQGAGQNTLRGDNPTIDTAGDSTLNALEGLIWDAGFSPDFMIQHHLGLDTAQMPPVVTHFADGAQLLTQGGADPAGPPQGGRFDGGTKSSTNLTGDLVNRIGFGDNTDPSPETANGSEINGLYATTDGDFLYLLVTGNLETNFTKLDIFFDIIPNRGQNTLIWDGDPVTGEPTPAFVLSNPNDPNSPLVPNPAYVGNPPLDTPNMFQQMGGPFPNVGSDPPTFQPGLTFDTGFNADHALFITNGSVGSVIPGEAEIFGGFARLRNVIPAADLGGTDPGEAIFWGQTRTSSFGFFENGDRGFSEIALAAFNNSNIGGVSGGPYFFGDVSDAPNVTTGMEIAIPLDDIKIPNGTAFPPSWSGTTPFKVTVILNGGAHSFVSNQILPHICSPELGNVREVNFATDHPGDQFLALSWNGSAFTVTNTATLPPDCDEPLGACCVGTSCSIELQSECEQVLGGTFLGDGTDCSGDPCTPTGACCFGDLCQEDFTEADCTGFGGTYVGDGTDCSGDPCDTGDPTGSCSFACSGNSQLPCFEATQADCLAAGGTYQGDNTDCTSHPTSNLCSGDINGDNRTNLDDFIVLAGNFGGVGARPQGDLNCDGIVNLDDFIILAGDFGCDKTALFQP